jgi:hypothetical protein
MIPIATLSLALIVLATVLAEVLITTNLQMSMRVKTTATMGVYDIDGTTKLTSIGLGDYMTTFGENSFCYPGRTNASADEYPINTFFVADVDQTNFSVQFIATNLPDYTLAWIRAWRGDSAPSNDWHEIDIQGSGSWTTSFYLSSPSLYPGDPPGAHVCKFQLWIQISLPQLPDPIPLSLFKTYTPTLTINAIGTS